MVGRLSPNHFLSGAFVLTSPDHEPAAPGPAARLGVRPHMREACVVDFAGAGLVGIEGMWGDHRIADLFVAG